jgi:hypothetical protein
VALSSQIKRVKYQTNLREIKKKRPMAKEGQRRHVQQTVAGRPAAAGRRRRDGQKPSLERSEYTVGQMGGCVGRLVMRPKEVVKDGAAQLGVGGALPPRLYDISHGKSKGCVDHISRVERARGKHRFSKKEGSQGLSRHEPKECIMTQAVWKKKEGSIGCERERGKQKDKQSE